MSGDLEDFLKRAAERRQAKAVEKKPSSKPAPPQYSDRRSERVPPEVQDEIVEATIVAEVASDGLSARRAEQEHRDEQARHHAKPAIVEAKPQEPETASFYELDSSGTNLNAVGFSAADLIMLLRQPGGVQQAILLREILDRPEHRW